MRGTGLCLPPLSHITTRRLFRKSPQRGTFIMLKDRSWARGKHLFQGLCHKRMIVSVHQPQSQGPAQLDRTFLCDRDWRDVTSAHTTGPAGPHTAHVHPAAKQTQSEPIVSGRSPVIFREGGGGDGVLENTLYLLVWPQSQAALPRLYQL